jgi:4-hydroxy-tetrahydrodipicolinate reductase
MAAIRIIQWSTGKVGIRALDAIFENPALELVGLWVHSEAKVGRDAATLVGRPACGVIATNDVDEILSLDADVVCYTANGELRPFDVLDEICRLLACGKNVVSSSLAVLHPDVSDASFTDPLRAACAEGNSSCFFSGIDPGFADDVLPIVLSGVSQRVTQVRVQEILNYSTNVDAATLVDLMGFGTPLDTTPLILVPGVLTMAWGGPIRILADALGVQLDRIDEWHERRAFDRDIDGIAGRTFEAGTQTGLRFEVRGMVADDAVIVLEHVTRLHDDIAPDWPVQHGEGGYRITILGEPMIECTFHAVGSDGTTNTGGLVVTATKLLNSVPGVVAAAPGIVTVNDLPFPTGRGLVRTTASRIRSGSE